MRNSKNSPRIVCFFRTFNLCCADGIKTYFGNFLLFFRDDGNIFVVCYLQGVVGLYRQVRFESHIAGIKLEVDKSFKIAVIGGVVAVVAYDNILFPFFHRE